MPMTAIDKRNLKRATKGEDAAAVEGSGYKLEWNCEDEHCTARVADGEYRLTLMLGCWYAKFHHQDKRIDILNLGRRCLSTAKADCQRHYDKRHPVEAVSTTVAGQDDTVINVSDFIKQDKPPVKTSGIDFKRVSDNLLHLMKLNGIGTDAGEWEALAARAGLKRYETFKNLINEDKTSTAETISKVAEALDSTEHKVRTWSIEDFNREWQKRQPVAPTRWQRVKAWVKRQVTA